jgi:hypothetical protein
MSRYFLCTVILATPAWAQSIDYKLISGCVPCHGADGIAKFAEVPNLAGQNEPYLLNQLHAFHAGKRVHKEMHYRRENWRKRRWRRSRLTSRAFRQGDARRLRH